MILDTALKRQRLSKGITQVEIAQKCSITESSYQRYESGQREPWARTAIRQVRVHTKYNIKIVIELDRQIKNKINQIRKRGNKHERYHHNFRDSWIH